MVQTYLLFDQAQPCLLQNEKFQNDVEACEKIEDLSCILDTETLLSHYPYPQIKSAFIFHEAKIRTMAHEGISERPIGHRVNCSLLHFRFILYHCLLGESILK